MKMKSTLVLVLALALVPASAVAQGFGGSVLVTDGEVLVGEPTSEREPGTVRVFRVADWSEVGMIRAPDAVVRDRFGTALARAGTTLFVSAPDAGDGVIHTYEGSGDSWRHTGRIESPGLHDFGRSLAAAGNHLLVGATDTDTEAALVVAYRADGSGGWVADGSLTPIGDAAAFGASMGLAATGETVLIGAPAAGGGAGAAYVFARTGDDSWSQTARLEGLGGRVGFGSAVGFDGSVALVGAPGVDRGTGAVYRFTFHELSGWRVAQTIGPPAMGGPGAFGAGLAYDGEMALIGAPFADQRMGRVYALTPGDDEWTVDAGWTVDGESLTQAGAILAVGAGIGVAGMPSDDFGAGSAWVTSNGALNRIASEQIGLDAIAGGQVDCEEGTAEGFDCDRVDLLSFLPREELGAGRGARLNDVWGWTDPDTGREYALVGRMDGTAFVDVTDAFNPRYLGNLAKTPGSQSNTWRDMKVYQDHMFVVADGAGQHGMQVFDLKRLRDVTSPQEFEPDVLYDGIASSHNVAINEETGFAYLVGSSGGGETCGGGSHIVDVNDPLNPTFAGCFAHPNTGRRNTGNSHDTQCVIYHGPDEDYVGREICMNANETALSIADVTDKDNPIAISQATYPNVSYAHQGWLTEDHRYFYSNDETDEVNGLVPATRTLIWDVTDLDDPLLEREYYSETQATDHNMYVQGDKLYMSNNRAGLRVLDVSDPLNPVEIGSFDTTPWSEDAAGFDGTWSVYPYFASGTILLSSRREGLFLVKPKEDRLVP